MSNHIYVRSDRFRNRNCPYALVNGIVFSSIYYAESYCVRERLDVNTCIQSDDAGVLAECQQIARVTLPMLREIRAHFSRTWGIIKEDLQRTVAIRDEAKAKHELGWRVHDEWVDKAVGRCQGFYEGMALIDPYIETLERVCRLELHEKEIDT